MAAATSVTKGAPPTYQIGDERQKIDKERGINIARVQLKEYAGLKPDDVLVCNWLKDKTMDPVKVEDLLKLKLSLKKSEFEGEPPISFTFKTAVQFMVDLINEKMTYPNDGVIPVTAGWASKNIYYEFFTALRNIKTPRPELLSSPPKYPFPYSSAQPIDLNFLDGAIIHMLYQQRHISGYGCKGGEFWIEI